MILPLRPGHPSGGCDKAKTVFVDDNVTVLQSARDFGVEMLLHITRPDSQRPEKPHDDFTGIRGVGELI